MKRSFLHIITLCLCTLFLFAPEKGVAVDLKIGLPLPENTKEHQLLVDEAQKISNETGGRIKLQLSFLSDEEKFFGEEVVQGKLDGCLAIERDFKSISNDPAVFAYALPFLFTRKADVEKVRGKLDKEILEQVSKGPVTSFSFVGLGFNYLVSAKPMSTLNQIRDGVIWVPPLDSVTSMGVEANELSLSRVGIKQVLNGLKNEQIDAVIAPLPLIIMKRWHIRLRNMLTYPVSYTYGIWVVSDSVFEQLSENEKEGLKAAFQVLGEKLSGAIEQRNESAEKVMKRYKTSFLPPSSSLETEWRTVYRVKSSELFNDKGFSLKQIADKIEKILID